MHIVGKTMFKQTLIGLALSFAFNTSAAKLILKSHYTGEVLINNESHDEILADETLAYVDLKDGDYKLKIGNLFECSFAIKDNQDVRLDTRVIESQTILPVYNFLYGEISGTEKALNDYKKLVNSDNLTGVYSEIDSVLPEIKSMHTIVEKGLMAYTKASGQKYNGRVRYLFASSGQYRTYKDVKVDGEQFSGYRYSRKTQKWHKSSFKANELHPVDLLKFAKRETSEAALFAQTIMQVQLKNYSEATATINKLQSSYKEAFIKAVEDMKSGMAVFKIKDIQAPSFTLPYDFYDIMPEATPDSIRNATKNFFMWLKAKSNFQHFNKVFAKSHGSHDVVYLQAQKSFFDLETRIQNDYLFGMWYQWQKQLVANTKNRSKERAHLIIYSDKPGIEALIYFVRKDKNGNPKLEPTILR